CSLFLVLCHCCLFFSIFFFNHPATPEIYTLSLHDALPISGRAQSVFAGESAQFRIYLDGRSGYDRPAILAHHAGSGAQFVIDIRSEEHTSELQSLRHLVCRLLLEKKKKKK